MTFNNGYVLIGGERIPVENIRISTDMRQRDISSFLEAALGEAETMNNELYRVGRQPYVFNSSFFSPVRLWCYLYSIVSHVDKLIDSQGPYYQIKILGTHGPNNMKFVKESYKNMFDKLVNHCPNGERVVFIDEYGQKMKEVNKIDS